MGYIKIENKSRDTIYVSHSSPEGTKLENDGVNITPSSSSRIQINGQTAILKIWNARIADNEYPTGESDWEGLVPGGNVEYTGQDVMFGGETLPQIDRKVNYNYMISIVLAVLCVLIGAYLIFAQL